MKALVVYLWPRILLPPACVLSFFSFMFRADTSQEVWEATLLNFVLTGPLWAGFVFSWQKSLRTGVPRSTLAALCTYLLVATGHSVWTATILKIRSGPSPSKAVANQQLFLIQAIVDYRAEKGMLPYSFEDLVPRYLGQLPENQHVTWQPGTVSYYHKALYHFGNNEGWENIDLPAVIPTRPSPSGEAAIRARLEEYDRRIAIAPTNEQHYLDRIAYLLSLGRQADAFETCHAAAQALPNHWRPQMGLAVLADPSARAGAEQGFHNWLEKHPAFIRYWCLARYYRDRGRNAEAISALKNAAKYPLEDLAEGTRYVPSAFAFDATKFAYQQGAYELVLDLTRAWSQARGVYRYPDDNVSAFRAAAELALGRVEDSRQSVSAIWPKYSKGGLLAENLEQLHRGAMNGNTTFVYDPGHPEWLGKWKLFPTSDDPE